MENRHERIFNNSYTGEKRKIINFLIEKGDQTLSELSRNLNNSIPTTTKIVNEMLENSLLESKGKQTIPEGRSPEKYGLNPDFGSFLGVEVQKDRMNIGYMDFRGMMQADIKEVTIPTGDGIDPIGSFCDTLRKQLDAHQLSLTQICACTIVVPMVAQQAESIFGIGPKHSDELEATLTGRLEEELGFPIHFDFVTRTLAFAEHLLYYPEEKDMIYINLSDSLELAMIVNGNMVYGHTGHCGSIGHMSILDNNRICRCGKTGCLETEVSGHALVQDITAKIDEGRVSTLQESYREKCRLSQEEVILAIVRGDTLAISCLETMAKLLGKVASGIINLLNPGLVVLGGDFAVTGDYLLFPFLDGIQSYGKRISQNDTQITLAKTSKDDCLWGACLTARNKLFAPE